MLNEAQRLGLIARDLCEAIGEEYHLIGSVLVEPRSVTYTIYETNHEGRKFVASDGNVALRTIVRPLEWPTA